MKTREKKIRKEFRESLVALLQMGSYGLFESLIQDYKTEYNGGDRWSDKIERKYQKIN
tara:strand:- start:371 stop:544 length:174 start_codon:yes stop_codon:yes gene_type:complete